MHYPSSALTKSVGAATTRWAHTPSEIQNTIGPPRQSSSWVWCLRKANARVRRGMCVCSWRRRRAPQPRCGGRGARRTNRMYSRSDGTLYTSTPLGNLSLASTVESSGSTCTQTRCVGCLIGRHIPLSAEEQGGNVFYDGNVSRSHAYDHTMHLSPCFQLAGVARLCSAVSCNESSTRRTCVGVRARAGV